MMAPVKDPDKIREALTRVSGERQAAETANRKATTELRRLLRDAQKAEGLSMSEAAKLAGISRVSAYELLKN